MGSLSGLFNAASGDSVFGDERIDAHVCPLNKDSSMDDILDWVVLTLCGELDVREMAFKGGYVLSKLLPKSDVRGTRDIDFSIYRKAYYEDVKKSLAGIGDLLVKSGVCIRYEIKDTVEPTMSGGITFYPADQTTRQFGVDVGLHDISYGTHRVELGGAAVIAFTPERMLSDKISAMFTRKRFRRSKDLYDLYVITNNFDVDFKELTNLISIRGELDYGLSPIRDEIMDGYKHAYEMLDINVNNTDYGNSVVKPAFDVVIDRARVMINNLNTSNRWNHILRKVE